MTPEQAIIEHMTRNNFTIDRGDGEVNIIYLEGVNTDYTPNPNALDGWNDLSIILKFDATGEPSLAFIAECTTEPGKAATYDSAARRLGGVARIAFGQQKAWRVGHHRYAKWGTRHPALVQCAPVLVHRDSNRDGSREGDATGWAYGLNQHGTSGIYTGGQIGNWSRGCLVRRWWQDHLEFMSHIYSDPRHVKDKKHIFSTTIIAGKDFFSIFDSEKNTHPV